MEEARERFNEALEIIDAALINPVVSHSGKYWKFENLNLTPGVFLQPSPPKWTTVVSTGSAQKSAQRRSKICTGFESVVRISEIFEAYRSECTRLGLPAGPDQLAIRRNISISRDAAAAREEAVAAKAVTLKVVAAIRASKPAHPPCSMPRRPAPDFRCTTTTISRARRRGPRTDHRAMPHMRCGPFARDPRRPPRRAAANRWRCLARKSFRKCVAPR